MTEPGNKTVIIIAGPTAVGKTALAIDIALPYQTEIISADSRQCYKELNIGVARPSVTELQKLPHHFIASHSISDELTAVSFEEYALDKTKELFKKHDQVVMTGGTGLYIRTFCEGMDLIPEVPTEIRSRIQQQYESGGIDWLKSEIQSKDPQFYEKGEIHNPQRMMRALEVMETTGESILSFRKGERKQRDFNIIKIAIDLPREILYERINKRVEQMMASGLLDEVKSLKKYEKLNALQTVGYSELFDYLDGRSTLEEAVDLIKLHTRRYAKRQLTWFRREGDWTWFQPDDIKAIQEYLDKELEKFNK